MVIAPKKAIAKNNVYGSVLGINENDRDHLSKAVSAAVVHLPGKTFCNHSDRQLEAAIRIVEAADARLKVCVASWGACSLLARSLMGQTCNLSDDIAMTQPATPSASAPEPATSAPSPAFHTPPVPAGAPLSPLGQALRSGDAPGGGADASWASSQVPAGAARPFPPPPAVWSAETPRGVAGVGRAGWPAPAGDPPPPPAKFSGRGTCLGVAPTPPALLHRCLMALHPTFPPPLSGRRTRWAVPPASGELVGRRPLATLTPPSPPLSGRRLHRRVAPTPCELRGRLLLSPFTLRLLMLLGSRPRQGVVPTSSGLLGHCPLAPHPTPASSLSGRLPQRSAVPAPSEVLGRRPLAPPTFLSPALLILRPRRGVATRPPGLPGQ